MTVLGGGGERMHDGFGTRIDDDGVLWLSGELDLAGVDAVRAAASAAMDGQRRFVVDLSELTFMDSSGIRAIVAIARTTSKGIVLRNPPDRVRKLIGMTGVEGRDGIAVE
jgi:anti-anti-sigma factor